MAFQPPHKRIFYNYDARFCVTKSAKRIAMMLTTPTHQREPWQAYDGQVPLILFHHGNADDLVGTETYCSWLAENLNVNVLTYDYIGYGQSDDGNMDETSLLEASSAVHTYVVNSMRRSFLVTMGKSLGCAPAISLCSEFGDHYAGCVLISPFASGVRTLSISRRLPLTLLRSLDNVFCNSMKRARNIQCPVQIIHGLQDEIIPVENSYDLCRSIKADLLFDAAFYGSKQSPAHHNDIESKWTEDICEKLSIFLRHVEKHKMQV